MTDDLIHLLRTWPAEHTSDVALLNEAADALEAAKRDLAEMTRRRDEWRKKGEGYDELAAAVRTGIENAGGRNLSRVFMRGAMVELQRENEAMRALCAEARQRLSYDAETFHDQGCWDREGACLALMKRIDAALATDQKGGE